MLNSRLISTSLKTIGTGRFLMLRSFSVTSKINKEKNVAMILSGCGVYDGAEIVEASSAIIHLSKHNANIMFYAPNTDQLHVINHLTGEISPENRNVLVESARIARGNIKPIDKLRTSSFDALVIPGGFGAAKNLSDYAIKDVHMTINKDVERIINEFVLASKPIGFCCISPVICAKMLPSCKITIGKNKSKGEWPYGDNIDNLRLMGAEMIEKDVDQVQVDDKYKIVTTPAFMKNATFFEVFQGIGKMIDEVIKMAG